MLTSQNGLCARLHGRWMTLPSHRFSYLFTGSGETPTLETVDSYMKKLHTIIVSNPQEHENLINTVRDVVNRLDRYLSAFERSLDGFPVSRVLNLLGFFLLLLFRSDNWTKLCWGSFQITCSHWTVGSSPLHIPVFLRIRSSAFIILAKRGFYYLFIVFLDILNISHNWFLNFTEVSSHSSRFMWRIFYITSCQLSS